MARWGSMVVNLFSGDENQLSGSVKGCRRGEDVREVACAGEAVSVEYPLSRAFGKKRGWSFSYPPTLEDASVSELRVLDLPALGLPTSPIRGSRGIVDGREFV